MDLKIGQVYTFNTVSPAFLGAVIEQAKLKSITDAETARRFAPLDQIYAQVYPSLPEGTPFDVENTIYYLFEGQNGSAFIIAEPWIVESSLTVVQYTTISVVITKAELSDVQKIRAALIASGFTEFTIKTQ